MRESPVNEVRLNRFDVWQSAVCSVAAAAVAAPVAWALAVAPSRGNAAWTIVCVAALLAAASVLLALSLVRVSAGVLSCRDGEWTFAADSGRRRSGALTIAIDLGAFLLLRIDGGPKRRLWLPLQRRGLEHEWHALRCALYSPPAPAQARDEAPSAAAE